MKGYPENVRKTAPLIHCITNYVTANDVANMIRREQEKIRRTAELYFEDWEAACQFLCRFCL